MINVRFVQLVEKGLDFKSTEVDGLGNTYTIDKTEQTFLLHSSYLLSLFSPFLFKAMLKGKNCLASGFGKLSGPVCFVFMEALSLFSQRQGI